MTHVVNRDISYSFLCLCPSSLLKCPPGCVFAILGLLLLAFHICHTLVLLRCHVYLLKTKVSLVKEGQGWIPTREISIIIWRAWMLYFCFFFLLLPWKAVIFKVAAFAWKAEGDKSVIFHRSLSKSGASHKDCCCMLLGDCVLPYYNIKQYHLSNQKKTRVPSVT